MANKYRAIRTKVDNITFDSKREAARYQELKLLRDAGEISSLVLQPKFPIQINDVKICTYIADFEYEKDGKTVVEDSKGVLTPIYRIKKKLVKALYGVEIQEV